MNIEPTPKRPRSGPPDEKTCVLCMKKIDGTKEIVKNPTVEGLKTIFSAVEKRKDTTYDNLIPYKNDILTGKIHISYHKLCRGIYTSKTNLKYVEASGETGSAQESGTTHCGSSDMGTRLSRTDSFNIRQECFICGKINKVSKRKEKLTQITTGTGEGTRQKVLNAALARGDLKVQMRMLSHPDLFAFDAKYHRSCYAAYISQRNISVANRQTEDTNQKSTEESAFGDIVQQINRTVLSSHKCVVTLAQIRNDYLEKLAHYKIDKVVFSWKLKERLKKHFGDKLVFIQVTGKSNILCSSSLTISDALKKACELQNTIDNQDDLEELSFENPEIDECKVLHTAAGILRKTMAEIKESNDYYEPSTDLNIERCTEFVPVLLYNFISWITNEKMYQEAKALETPETSKCDIKAIALCHNIIAQNNHMRVPITLGLGLYVHHEFGSRQLIENLNALGYSISYDEVRRFLTSAAIDQQEENTYIPRGLDTNDGILIDAAIDNFDKNEDTIDGKRTTHSMAAVIYKRSSISSNTSSFHRTTKKAAPVSLQDEVMYRYMKPRKRPEPPTLEDAEFSVVNSSLTCHTEAQQTDLAWKISRLKGSDQFQKVPGWTGFNSLISNANQPVATIRYLPFIQAPPSDFTTIYTTLCRLVKLAETLNQSHILITADMAIYSKAQEILWSKPQALEGKVTMRLGGMHLTMAYLASLGCIYGEAGLLDLLVDSDVYAQNTARQMIQGKEYARGLRGIRIVQEALFRCFYNSMESWLKKQNRDLMIEGIDSTIQGIQAAVANNDRVSVIHLVAKLKVEMSEVQNVIDEFRKIGEAQSETFSFWCKFLDGADILLRLLRAEREADFLLHINATRETVPWFNAASRRIYAKYVPTYIGDMIMLEQKHPESFKHLCDGGFVVRRSDSRNFNCVASDQALEQTVNREGKGTGGVVGLTLRKGALHRWLKTRHITSEYVESFTSLCSNTVRNMSIHPECKKSRAARDEADVCKIVETCSQYQNPFDLDNIPSELINLTTGQKASNVVSESLATFLDTGKKAMNTFILTRLVESSKSKSFWDTVAKTKVTTFAHMSKNLVCKKVGEFSADSEVIFRRLLAISKQRDINMENVLGHELAVVPPSLFNNDGTMRKTMKSELASKLEASCPQVQCLSPGVSTAYLIDGMALLQGLNETLFTTFKDISFLIKRRLKQLLNGELTIGTIVIVFDRYDNELSIKQLERQRRGEEQRASHIITENRQVPTYRKFMKNSGNKAALAKFVSEYLISTRHELLEDDQFLILAGGFEDGEVVKLMSNSSVSELHSLYTSQEEADTRLILHSIHLCPDYERLIIRSDDTDVLVLLLYYTSMGMINTTTYMHAGHTTQYTQRERFIPINSIVENVGSDLCHNLPAAHALTGCDSTSSLFKVGKRTAFTQLVNHIKKHPTELSHFGMTQNIDDDVDSARRYILSMYGSRGTGKASETLDNLRYMLASTTDKSAAQLPPTEDSFRQHVLRARYQTSVWCQSHVAKPILCSPVGNGWRLSDDSQNLEPVFYLKDQAPTEVRDLTHMFCTDTSCNSEKCVCTRSGLACIDICACRGFECGNSSHIIIEGDSDGED